MSAVLGMKKLHYSIHGGHFISQTGQKPLVSILKKHMVVVSPRIQGIAITSKKLENLLSQWIT